MYGFMYVYIYIYIYRHIQLCILYIYNVCVYYFFLMDISCFTNTKPCNPLRHCLMMNQCTSHNQLSLAMIAHNDMVETILVTQHY